MIARKELPEKNVTGGYYCSEFEGKYYDNE